jgi:hypothetical protein
VDGDSFFIQQSWDVNRRVRIYKKNYTLTDIYYEPGYHMAKLMVNDKVIKTFDVSIPTGDWFFYAKTPAIPRSTPVYIKPVQPPARNGILSLNKEDLSANLLDWQNEKQYIYSIFPEKLEVSADNYVFKTRIRVREVRNNFCPTLMCEVFCQRNFMFLKNTSPGCSSEAMLQFGDDFKHGRQHDLSFLGKDVTQWMDIEIRVQDKQVTVLMDKHKIYSTAYNVSSGLITGLGFISNGLCEVDYAELKGLDGNTVFANDFN